MCLSLLGNIGATSHAHWKNKKTKSLISQKEVCHRAKIGAQKSVKQIAYWIDCVTYGDGISLFPCRSLGEGEEGQVSSSLVVIHTVGLWRRSSKLQTYSEVERGRRIGETSKGSSLWGSESLLFIEVPCQTLMGPPLVGIGSASNKTRAPSDISYPNLYSSQCLPYVDSPVSSGDYGIVA